MTSLTCISLPYNFNANLMVYADDILLSKPIATSSDLTALQSDLNLISNWLSNNLLTMNVNKT